MRNNIFNLSGIVMVSDLKSSAGDRDAKEAPLYRYLLR